MVKRFKKRPRSEALKNNVQRKSTFKTLWRKSGQKQFSWEADNPRQSKNLQGSDEVGVTREAAKKDQI